MKENGNAPVGAATPTGAKSGDEANGSFSDKNFTAVQRNGQAYISAFLMHGAENAVSATDLAAVAGFGDDLRRLRFLVTRERQHGTIILSDAHGYFLPSLNETQREGELRAFKRRFDKILRTNRANLASVNKALKKLDNGVVRGQTSIFGGAENED